MILRRERKKGRIRYIEREGEIRERERGKMRAEKDPREISRTGK